MSPRQTAKHLVTIRTKMAVQRARHDLILFCNGTAFVASIKMAGIGIASARQPSNKVPNPSNWPHQRSKLLLRINLHDDIPRRRPHIAVTELHCNRPCLQVVDPTVLDQTHFAWETNHRGVQQGLYQPSYDPAFFLAE